MLAADDLGLFAIGDKVALSAVYKRKEYNLGEAIIVRKQETVLKSGERLRPGFGLAFVGSARGRQANLNLLLR